MKLIIFLCSLLSTWLIAFALECAHRNMGFDGTVCVCNVTYCDNIAPLVQTAKGVVTSYVTSLAGDRFHKSELHFSVAQTNLLANSTISIAIDPKKQYQKIIGFGGAFTDSTGGHIDQLPKEMQTRLIKDYFGSDGLEYTLGRIPIGGSDFSPRLYSYHEFPDDDNLTKFALQQEDLKYKIPFIHLAQQVSPHKIKLFGSPWSPPAWIKDNHKLNGGGYIIGQPGGRYYKIFARYFVKFIQEYEKQKVDIWGITVENEPLQGVLKSGINSLALNGTLERDFVKLDLGPELHANGYTKDKLKVMIHDDNVKDANTTIEQFVTPILVDPEAAKYVSGIAYHWYEPSDRTEIERLYHRFQGTFLLGTEACQLAMPKPGEWKIFEQYAQTIINDLNHFSSGWTDWNMVLDPLGRNWPTSTQPGLDSPVLVNFETHEYFKQPTFYAMGHFSKFISPDSVRLHHEANVTDNISNNIHLTVFKRPDNGTVLVVLNLNKHSIQLQVHDPANGYVTVDVKAQALESLIWY